MARSPGRLLPPPLIPRHPATMHVCMGHLPTTDTSPSCHNTCDLPSCHRAHTYNAAAVGPHSVGPLYPPPLLVHSIPPPLSLCACGCLGAAAQANPRPRHRGWGVAHVLKFCEHSLHTHVCIPICIYALHTCGLCGSYIPARSHHRHRSLA